MYKLSAINSPSAVWPVIMTPLPEKSTSTNSQTISKILLKAVSKVGKDSKLFTLRDVPRVVSRDELRSTIKRQLKEDVITGEFDVGVVKGSNIISIRNQADLQDFWADILAGKNTILWCDGLKNSSTQGRSGMCTKRKRNSPDENESEGESDEPPKKSAPKKKKVSEEREECVQTTVKKLKEKHGSKFTQMQVRIWSEMIAGNIHSSLEEPPKSSMFVRAGKEGTVDKRKNEGNSPMAEALTKAAVALSSALSPQSVNQYAGMSTSPAKQIEARSKCYKQLNELKNLKESGVLTDIEYADEKVAVLGILKKLKGD